VVGYLGDGINDAPALKVADIGLSVEGATGVAQAAADMILLASDLEVVADGVRSGQAGRRRLSGMDWHQGNSQQRFVECA